ncbi:MAG TPA: DUF2332 domain-containing protein [Gaiellaceae bacterium]|nr:DUF2332 domain-containing protein [Gaiellaceae bacterium]
MAKAMQSASPVVAAVFRRCAKDPLSLEALGPDPSWDAPHRLLAGVRVLALRGEVEDFELAEDSWGAFRAILGERREWLATFVRERPVQTNEVQRCWTLVPIFLTVARAARRPLALIELGASAGLNLLWDRYRYSYRAGTWGDPAAPVRLEGEERSAVPGELLCTGVDVSTRVGIDLAPVDATSEDGMHLLKAFVRDDGYRARLEQAASMLRSEPPRLVRGDYLEVLPELLGDRDETSMTVVFQTHSTVYLTDEERGRLRSIVEAAGAEGPLAWISTPTPEEHGQRRGDYPLELATWPGGSRRIVARTSVRAEWLEWSG